MPLILCCYLILTTILNGTESPVPYCRWGKLSLREVRLYTARKQGGGLCSSCWITVSPCGDESPSWHFSENQLLKYWNHSCSDWHTHSILLTDITSSNHICWWPLFSRVTQTLCHSHPLCVMNTNQVNFIPVFEDLGLLCFLLEAASFLLKKCTLWEAFTVFWVFYFFFGGGPPAKRQNLKALLSQCGRPCHFQHCRLILQPPPKHLSGDVTSLWNYTGWFKNRRQGFPRQRILSGCPLLPPFCTCQSIFILKKKKSAVLK